MIEVTLKYRLQTIEQFLCVLFQVGYTVIYLFSYLLNEEINTGMSEKKNKRTLFSSWATLLSAVETDMDRMRLERAFCYFYSCAKRVTHSGTPLRDFIDLFLDSFAAIWWRMTWKTGSELFDG